MNLFQQVMDAIHAPLTPETDNLFDKDVVRMKKHSYLVNTARGRNCKSRCVS